MLRLQFVLGIILLRLQFVVGIILLRLQFIAGNTLLRLQFVVGITLLRLQSVVKILFFVISSVNPCSTILHCKFYFAITRLQLWSRLLQELHCNYYTICYSNYIVTIAISVATTVLLLQFIVRIIFFCDYNFSVGITLLRLQFFKRNYIVTITNVL